VNSAPRSTHAKQGWLPTCLLSTRMHRKSVAVREIPAMVPLSANEKARLPAGSCNSWWVAQRGQVQQCVRYPRRLPRHRLPSTIRWFSGLCRAHVPGRSGPGPPGRLAASTWRCARARRRACSRAWSFEPLGAGAVFRRPGKGKKARPTFGPGYESERFSNLVKRFSPP
jgi:hypothetical protein